MDYTRKSISETLTAIGELSENRYITPEELEEIDAMLIDVYTKAKSCTFKTSQEKMIIDCFRKTTAPETKLREAIEQ